MPKIDTFASRSRLKVRKEPYWSPTDTEQLYVGFRRGPDSWIARLQSGSNKSYRSLGKQPDFRAAIRAAKDWHQTCVAGVTNARATVADACRDYLGYISEEKGEEAAREARARLQHTLLGRTKTEATSQRCSPVPSHPLARKELGKVTRADLTKLRESLVSPGLKNEPLRKARATANRYLGTVLAMLNHAHRVQLVANNSAWASLSKYRNTRARNASRYLSVVERGRLLEEAAGGIKDLLEGLILLGARPIELQRAKVSDYDAASSALTLISNKGPAERERKIPLKVFRADKLVRRLTTNKLPTAYIWTKDNGARWAHSDHDHLVRETAARAGLSKVTAYAIRHSWLTDAIAAGVDPLTCAKVAGTSVEQISSTYGKLVESHAEKAFSKVKLL